MYLIIFGEEAYAHDSDVEVRTPYQSQLSYYVSFRRQMQVCQLDKNEPAHQSNICFTINAKIKPIFFFFLETHTKRERQGLTRLYP